MSAATNHAQTAKGQYVHFVIPAYNESASIGDLIDRIGEFCTQASLKFRILVIDDGSVDKTGEISRDRAQIWPVEVLRNDPNGGLGYTIRRGLKTASETAGSEDILVTLDADLTQDPKYTLSMLNEISKGADVVIASRYRKGSKVNGLSLFRLGLSYGASAFIMLLRPIQGVRDYSCGFRAYRSSAIKWGFERFGDNFISEQGFACMVEIAERLRDNAIFKEVPFVLHYEAKRKSSEIKVWPTILAYIRVMMRIRKDLQTSNP